MVLFHVPRNVSSYIMCSSKSACPANEVAAEGFAAWYSCPVCTYRICSGCASLLAPNMAEADSQKFTLENLFKKQFSRFGSYQNNHDRELFIERTSVTQYIPQGEFG